MYGFLADVVVVIHIAFVVFVVAGGLLALRWPWMAAVHLPAAVWGAVVEFAGLLCPLTPLENRLRELAGQTGYGGDFVARYLLPMLYPEGLTRDVQIALGVAVVAMNVVIYGLVVRRARGSHVGEGLAGR